MCKTFSKLIPLNPTISHQIPQLSHYSYIFILLGIKENQILKIIRDTLLPKLLSGEINVSSLKDKVE